MRNPFSLVSFIVFLIGAFLLREIRLETEAELAPLWAAVGDGLLYLLALSAGLLLVAYFLLGYHKVAQRPLLAWKETLEQKPEVRPDERTLARAFVLLPPLAFYSLQAQILLFQPLDRIHTFLLVIILFCGMYELGRKGLANSRETSS